MAFTLSKFNIPSYSGGGYATYIDYADFILNSFKTAFIATNSAWSLESDIEPVGSYTGTNPGIRTLQLQSSASNKHLRIWCFTGSVTCSISETEGTNTTSSLKIYAGNLFKQNESSQQSRYSIGYRQVFYFGVSSSSIDADFAKDLHLDVPIFSVSHSLTSSSQQLSYYTYDIQRYGGTISVISDGSMFNILRYTESALTLCMYAEDMYICANSNDEKTSGVVLSTGEFYLGDNKGDSNRAYSLFTDSNGAFDFNGMLQGFSNERDNNSGLTASSSTKMVCYSVKFWMYPETYSGSSMQGVVDGIGLKGWINPNYLRSVDVNILTPSMRGMKYGNGTWFCISAGTLICWDDSNSSPFEPAL